MDKYKRFYGIFIIVAVIACLFFVWNKCVSTQFITLESSKSKLTKLKRDLETKSSEKNTVEERKKKREEGLQNAQKKIYSPVMTDLGDESLFFTLYSDILEMVHSNSVKIKSMQYNHNPDTDEFVKQSKNGGGLYFVSDINMELVSNYVNLGKLIESLYQYPYFIKITKVDVKPYQKDKKVLLTSLSIRVYAYTEPSEEAQENDLPKI